jgi:hypothetical protein
MVLSSGNSITDHHLPMCDAFVVGQGTDPSNGYAFRDCTFRGCSFVRVTLMVTQAEFQSARNVDWLRWINARPDSDGELLLEPKDAVSTLPSNKDRAA